MRYERDRKRGEGGFSLLELLVALVILALIMGIAGPRVIGYMGRAKGQTAEAQVKTLQSALDLFLMDVGRYPSEEEGLAALLAAPAGAPGWSGPYLTEDFVPDDPWGRAYLYRADPSGLRVSVITLGRDGAEGGSGEDADVGLRKSGRN